MLKGSTNDLRDLKARQRFLQESISRNRLAYDRKKMNALADTTLVNRMSEHYDSVNERRYSRLRNKINNL